MSDITPFQRGRDAYFDQYDLDENPYDPESIEYDQWEAGWKAADSSLEDEDEDDEDYE